MFTDLISGCFRFLIDEYGFAQTLAENDVMEFVAERCRVLVSVDRGSVSVDLRSNEPQIIRRLRCNLFDVVFLKDPAFHLECGYDPEAFVRDRIGTVQRQLSDQAELLRRYCDEMLHGDFSRREEIEQFRARAEAEFWARFPRVPG